VITPANNLTVEVEEYFANRQAKLVRFSMVWPIRIAVSRTRNLQHIGGPPAGTTQLHLVCGHRLDSGLICGQTVYVLKMGGNVYTEDLTSFQQGIARHIGICHMEVIDG
jgi:hypothetical protein